MKVLWTKPLEDKDDNIHKFEALINKSIIMDALTFVFQYYHMYPLYSKRYDN